MSRFRRRRLLLAVGVAFAMPLLGHAQQQRRVWRIGFLAVRSRSTAAHPDPLYDAFVGAMRELGYVEGRNLLIEWRFADGKYDRLPALAAELVQQRVDLIVTHSDSGTRAASHATKSIPIVSAGMGDPVRYGFARSLAHPGGNITGLSLISLDLAPKKLEILRIAIPKLSRLGVLVNTGAQNEEDQLKNVESAAARWGITVFPVIAHTPPEVESAFSKMKQVHVEAVLVLGDTFFILQRQQIADLALAQRTPLMFPFREQVLAGGLLSYGIDVSQYYRLAATYVDRILKGATAGDLPIEQPLKLLLVINQKTARALQINIPTEIMIRADEVIE